MCVHTIVALSARGNASPTIQAVIADMGNAMMGTGEATGEGRALRAAEDALSNPLMGELCIKVRHGK